jgi:uncharacterized membrane protein
VHRSKHSQEGQGPICACRGASASSGLGIAARLLFLTIFISSGWAQGIHVTLRSNPDPYPAYQSYAGVWGDGNFAYVGSERRNGVLIYDITNPDAPVLASYYGQTGPIDMEDIKVANGIGYFADNMGSGLHIVDVSDPTNPTLLSQITSANGGFDNTHKIAIWQNFVFIPQNLVSPAIIKVFDVSNPSSPVLKTTFTATDPKWVNDIDIQTNGTTGKTLLYTSGWGGKCDIWDITNIATANPVLLGSFTAGVDGSSASATADGNYLAYTTKNTNGTSFVTIYNISNPASVTVASTLTMTALGIDAVSPHDPKIMNNLLYVSWYQAGTLIFDITNPAAPVFVGTYDTWPGPVDPGQLDGNWGVYPYLGQDRVLLSDRNTGLYIVDATGVSSQPALYNLHLNPTTVLAGSSSTGTVYLVGQAGSGGAVVTTSSNNSAAVTPANVTVPNQGTNANFTVTTSTVSTTTTATITAAFGGASDSATLTITPVADFLLSAAPTSMTLYPAQQGTISGTLTAVAGYSSSVTLSCMGTAPQTCTFSPNPITPTTAGAPFTLTVANPASATFNFNLLATGGDSKTTTHSIPLTVNVADFNIGAPSPATLTSLPGQNTSFAMQVSATGAFTSAVDLSCNAPATGVGCSFAPSASVNPTPSNPVNVTTTVATTTSTPVGQYTLTVSGNSVNAPAPKTQNVTLNVVDFALGAPSPSSLTLIPGENSPVVAQVSALGSFSGAVTLSCNTPATGVTCNFSPSATVNPTSSTPVTVTITVATTTATPDGQYNLTISANTPGAPAPKTQVLTLTVADFTLGTPSPNSVGFLPGGNSTVTTQVTAMGSFAGAVTLSCNAPAAGVTCGFSPSATVNPTAGAPVTVTITVGTTTATPGGQYNVTVSATSAGAPAPKTQTVALAVMDFAITPMTPTQTVTPGQTASYPLNIAGVGGAFIGAVTLSCSGTPPVSTCGLAPNSVTPGSSGAPATLTVITRAPMSALRLSKESFYALWLPMIGIVFLGRTACRADTPVRRAPARVPALHERVPGTITLLILLLSLTACGGGSAPAPKPGTTPGTYTIMVTGTSGSLTHSVPVTLIVQ